jgi:ABC-type molybdate transport system substrate-binding protein
MALVATACSDAHTQAQRDWVDTGYDPNVLTLLNPPELNPVLTALGQAYLSVRPDTSLVLLNQVNPASGKFNKVKSNLTSTQIIEAGASPSLWIDAASTLKPYAHDPRAQGQIVPFAVEPMVLTVKAGNPAGVTGLDAYSAGGPTAGRCATAQTCGRYAYAWLAAAHIRPHIDLRVLDAQALVEAIAAGRVDTGAVLSLAIPPGDTQVTTVPVASPPAPALTFRMLAMSTNPTALQFEKWLSTSPQAHAILSSYGLLPGNGRAAT